MTSPDYVQFNMNSLSQDNYTTGGSRRLSEDILSTYSMLNPISYRRVFIFYQKIENVNLL